VRHKSGCPSGDFGPCTCKETVVKYAQALLAPMKDGKRWKLVLMSDRQCEVEYIGTFDDCQRELKHYAKTREWVKRSVY
jgi:hypothetical protein